MAFPTSLLFIVHWKNLQFQDQDRSMAILTGLSSLYENKQFTDVILCVDDQEFPCHKNVLAISSPFFMAMFSHDMTESHQLRIPIKVKENKSGISTVFVCHFFLHDI